MAAAITVIDEPFRGWQQEALPPARVGGRPGPPVTRILPRSLMVPPGIPDFLSRTRFLAPGPCSLEGRAWSGTPPVQRVEVSADDGRTWSEASLGEPVSDFAWQGWTYAWDAEPGEHVLCCRATDSAGQTQPATPEWNYDGFCNNVIQRVRVVVSEPQPASASGRL